MTWQIRYDEQGLRDEYCEGETEICATERCGCQVEAEDLKYCESCRREQDATDALWELHERVESMIENATGFSIGDTHYAGGTRSIYMEADLSCAKCLEWIRTWKVRVSDHGTAYCTEDFSFASANSNPDDHDVETFPAWLANAPSQNPCEECK